MNIGQFVASEIIILLIIASVEKLILGLESYYDVLTSIEKIGQVSDKPIERQEGDRISSHENITIELKEASYEVEDLNTPILNRISFTIFPKDRILVEGENGSGKSSLLQLISGINLPTSGHIFVNNLSIESLLINDFRGELGLSLSEETPFEGTIRENISFGNAELTDDLIFEVLEHVGLTDYVKLQPKGLNTILKPEGKHMAHTLAKKIVLARAIAKKPKVLILENPLDQFKIEETKKIIDFLTSPKQSWSLLVVSSNPIWRAACNKHIVLEKGCIKN